MIPVSQTEFARGSGNCLSACVASVLELSIDDVPNFCREDMDADGSTWMQRLGNWLAARGWGFVHSVWSTPVLPFNCYVIAMGRVERSEERHAVIAVTRMGAVEPGDQPGTSRMHYSLEYLFDPFPDGAGLDETEELLVLVPYR